MNRYRYRLEPYKGMNTRYICPGCGKVKTFTRYIDTVTGAHISPTVGKCERLNNCGYHYNPKQYFQDNPRIELPGSHAHVYTRPKDLVKPTSFIPVEVFKGSLQCYETNHFINFLSGWFGIEISKRLVETYFVGTSKYWPGATVFWQLDTRGNIRTGKIMLYNPATGKRVKEHYPPVTWAHTVLKLPSFQLRQCFFGEHLLRDETKPVAIVESEKTAIIASVYLPEFIWIATGGTHGCKWATPEVSAVLRGRNVILYPDLKAFDTWKTKAVALTKNARVVFSYLLERKATAVEREEGLDIADYLINLDYREFVREKYA